MEEATSVSEAQEDKTAEPRHPESSETAEHDQEEHAQTLEDKTTEPEDTNQLDDNNEKSNSALLQSDEPKSKVIDYDIVYNFTINLSVA